MTRYLIDEPALITVLLSAFSQGSHIFPTLSESVRAITFFHLLVGPVGIDWIGKIIYQHQGSKINTRDKKKLFLVVSHCTNSIFAQGAIFKARGTMRAMWPGLWVLVVLTRHL